jgi:hypothetical protein
MSRKSAWLGSILLAAAACSSSSTTSTSLVPTETTAPTATTEQPTTTAGAGPTTEVVPEGEIPPAGDGIVLAPYGTENETAGEIRVRWYRSTVSGNYVAVYSGPGVADSGPLCPGNSIQVAATILFPSNASSIPGGCEGFTTPEAHISSCDGGVWIYETLIPGDRQGTLWGKVEWLSSSGHVTGLTSSTDTETVTAEFDPTLISYSVPEGMTSDGSAVIVCGAVGS